MKNDRNELFSLVADKYLVREYVARKTNKVKIPKLYYQTQDPTTIPFGELPMNYVVKANHGQGWNILVNDGFDFLGFHFYRGIGGDGGWKPKVMIPQSKVQTVKDKVKALTERNLAYVSESIIISKLNSVLRGWGNYYRHVTASKTFRAIDHYVFERMVRWYRLKYQWSRKQVMMKRYTRDYGNRRLYAERDSSDGRKRIHLICLARDIKFKEYFHRNKDNPFLAIT